MAVSFQTKNSGDVCVLSPEGKIVIGDEVGLLREKIKELKHHGQELAVEQLDRVSEVAQAGKKAIQNSSG